MEKTKDELIIELEDLKQKYLKLEVKYQDEINRFKKNEEEAALRLLFLEGIANSTIDGYIVVNPFGQKILQNQRTIDLWKIPQEVANDPNGLRQVEHVMYMTVNPKQFIGEIDYLREHPNEKSLDELELIDGTFLDRYSSPVIGPDGKNYGRIWTFHDVTERKKFEKDLIQLNKHKDRFISILAHDLRSPFNSLLGISEILREELRNYSIEKIEEMVEWIYITSKNTFELLEDTLMWASVKSEKIIFNPDIVNVYDIISEVMEILEPMAQAKKITLINKSEKDIKSFADIYMFKAILRNLISNAIKFTNIEGKIEVSIIPSSTDMLITVSDNGVGIATDKLINLFRISSIQSSKGTANETGTGLGLLLCKEFVEMHGGKIWIDSKINEGTNVNFTLPTKK